MGVGRGGSHIPRRLVLGASNSSNTKRLVEVARRAGTPADLICEMDDLEAIDLGSAVTVGVTAGASTPEAFVARVLEALSQEGFEVVSMASTAEESVHFAIPSVLR